MATWKDLEDYKRVSTILENRVNHDLSVLLSKVKNQPYERIRDVFVEFVPALIDKYGSIAASAAADWFERLTDMPAFVPDLYKPETWAANTRWALSPLFDERQDLRAAFTHIVQVAKREVKNHGRLTIAESVKTHPNVRYARVLSGPTNCSFCIVLSSRGPVYGSKESAEFDSDGEKYHANCDCIAVPMRGSWQTNSSTSRGMQWSGDKVAGYDFEELYDREYKPFYVKNDDIKKVVSRRDSKFAAWRKQDEKQAKEYARRGGSLDQPTLQKEKWRDFRDSMDVKYDRLPLDKWATAKPIPRRFTELPIEWPEDLPHLSVKQWNHILYGLNGGGGHLHGYGWVSGGSEFPHGMTPRNIALLLKEILSNDLHLSEQTGKFFFSRNNVRYVVFLGRRNGKIEVKTFHPNERV